MTTTTIVEGCRRGERRFQRELVNRFSPQLHTVALRYLPDNAHAQDVLQDSLVKILTGSGCGAKFPPKPLAWTRR
jgi:RNA polymerase sigma-70 factor (ECF subfamily)